MNINLFSLYPEVQFIVIADNWGLYTLLGKGGGKARITEERLAALIDSGKLRGGNTLFLEQ